MFTSLAYAQTTTGTAPEDGPNALVSFMPLVLIFVIFYFLLIRPQQKRMKEQQSMISAIRRGDKVVTGGGIIGVVSKLEDDDTIEVEIAPNVRVKVARATITTVLTKPVPANGDSKPGKTAAGANDN